LHIRGDDDTPLSPCTKEEGHVVTSLTSSSVSCCWLQRADGRRAQLDGARISAMLFPLLGKTPILGRAFDANDDRPGEPSAVALI
jgi:hypothetical protein